MPRISSSTQSALYNGNTTLLGDTHRNYFFIIMITGTATIEFGAGGGEIPLPEKASYEPLVAPTSEVTVRADPLAQYVIHSNRMQE